MKRSDDEQTGPLEDGGHPAGSRHDGEQPAGAGPRQGKRLAGPLERYAPTAGEPDPSLSYHLFSGKKRRKIYRGRFHWKTKKSKGGVRTFRRRRNAKYLRGEGFVSGDDLPQPEHKRRISERHNKWERPPSVRKGKDRRGRRRSPTREFYEFILKNGFGGIYSDKFYNACSKGGMLRRGIPRKRGLTNEKWFKAVGEAERKAAHIVRKLSEKDLIDAALDIDDNIAAKAAMTKALSVMLNPHNRQDLQLDAAKAVLHFTKSRPALKHDLTLSAAEQWFAQVAHEEEEYLQLDKRDDGSYGSRDLARVNGGSAGKV